MHIETVSVIVPTRGRVDKLDKCLHSLARQQMPDGVAMEIFVVFDGDENAAASIDVGTIDRRISTIVIPQGGAGAARNAAIQRAGGELILFLNDDCYPVEDWLVSHVRAQQNMSNGGMCVGRTEWAQWDELTVFDALVRDTSMVFFEHDMVDGEDYGFRHFWTCNTSVPAHALRSVGDFDERLCPVFFEDVELGFRLQAAGVRGVRYVANANCMHDHRMTWEGYLHREAALGRMAVRLADVNTACFKAIFGYESADAMAADCSTWLKLNARDAARAANAMSTQMYRPWQASDDWKATCELLYLAHLPVKRDAFRRAFCKTISVESGLGISQDAGEFAPISA